MDLVHKIKPKTNSSSFPQSQTKSIYKHLYNIEMETPANPQNLMKQIQDLQLENSKLKNRIEYWKNQVDFQLGHSENGCQERRGNPCNNSKCFYNNMYGEHTNDDYCLKPDCVECNYTY